MDGIKDLIAWIILFAIIILLPVANADGIDHDKGFYGKDVIVKPNEITVWHNYNGIWIKELPRAQLPNGHFMLDKNNINYWRDFDEWPCYYPIWPNDGNTCINPGDRHYYSVDLKNDAIKAIPEPNIIGLLGCWLLFIGVRKKVIEKL